MNNNHLQQIFSHYIDRFEELNNKEHCEYYKWQVIKRFHADMDAVLSSSDEEFPAKLYELKKLTANLIDNYTQPFYGLAKFAEEEPQTVRDMFKNLFQDDGGDVDARQKRVQEFLKKSHALREKYYPDSYLYKDDMHSVTGYLFLYDPDHNYLFKSTHAQVFADCIEFYDEWGSGDDVNLSVYYRMCDQVAKAIKESKELLATDASRFEISGLKNEAELYPDNEKHILVFDLIYCCSSYGLFDGITFVRPKSKERQLMQERKEKAIRLSNALEEARKKVAALEEAKAYINSALAVGTTVHHGKYGDGTVKSNGGTSVVIEFPEIGEKQFGTAIATANGIIKPEVPGYEEKIEEYKDLLKKDSSIMSALSFAEKEFAPYSDYLE
ncbi:TPA: hypothetical protein KRF88_002737 [Clostridioides difficile]|nr:hypothetical protein [Clostridioides difficile]HBG8083988.1 hypothetical protein [Clostridioides difficile]HDQ2297359.1 hypothetical protein [Clostridioides difficile]HDQ2378821.1 hypothetical protein [Clostridioides difficile]